MEQAEMIDFVRGLFERDGGLDEPIPMTLELARGFVEGTLHIPQPNDFDQVKELAAKMLRDGDELPGWLAAFVADVLDGYEPPKQRGGLPNKHWVRDSKLATWVSEVAAEFKLPRYAKNSPKLTAAKVVSLATKEIDELPFVGVDVVEKAERNAFKASR